VKTGTGFSGTCGGLIPSIGSGISSSPASQLVTGLLGHLDCPAALTAAPVTHWAVVPSLPTRPGEYPLPAVAARFARWPEVLMTAAPQAAFLRAVSPRHYQAAAPLPPGAHVLLPDDTWASADHAQSAALALRAAGAVRISVLAVARLLSDDSDRTRAFLRAIRGRDYDLSLCPWTSGRCPGAPREPRPELPASPASD
jgi:hypothetical protein